MTIQPFRRWLLIKPVEKKQVLVSDDGTLNEQGEVIGVGNQVKEIKVGDKVGFSVFGVEKLIIDGQKHYFIKEDDEFLLGVITD